MAAVKAEVVLRHRPCPEREGGWRGSEGAPIALAAVAVMWSGSPLARLQVLRLLISAL